MLLANYQKGSAKPFPLLFEQGGTSAAPAIKSIFGNRKLAVNADGSSITYSPQFPRGGPSVLDNICNGGIKVFDEDGGEIPCLAASDAERAQYYDTFKRIRDRGWRPFGKMRLLLDPNILEIKSVQQEGGRKYQVPCVVRHGNIDYFVSRTGLHNAGVSGACRPDRYVDSLTKRTVVVPREWIGGGTWIGTNEFPTRIDPEGNKIAAGPVNKGDMVVVYNPGLRKRYVVDANGNAQPRWLKYEPKRRFIYAIVGEGGPPGKWGEASIAIIRELLDAPKPKNNVDVLRLDTDEQRVSMLVMPKTSGELAKDYSDNNVASKAGRAFSRWGGGSLAKATARFKACERYLTNISPETE